MASDPKIRYDIEAGVTGEANVARLATEFEKLDDSLDPALAERARLTAQRVRELGAQQEAIDRFVQLKSATEDAATALDKAQTDAQALARTLTNTQAPTRAQTRQLEELRNAVRQAKDSLEAQTAELDKARVGLTALGVPTEGLGRRQAELRTELSATSTELQRIATEADASRGLAQIATQTEATAAGLTEAQVAMQSFAARVAASEAPTAAEVVQLGEMADQLQRSRTQLEQQVQALNEQRTALTAAGVSTAALDARQAELAQQLGATVTELQQLGTRGAALRGFSDLVDQTEIARERLFQAERALADYRAGLSATTAPTAAQARQLGVLAEAARQAQIQFQTASQVQTVAAASLREAGVDTERLTAAQRAARLETSAMAQASREAAAAAALQGRTFVDQAGRQVEATTGVRRGLEGINEQLRTLQTLAAAAIGGQLLGGLAGDVARTADAYSNLAARVRIAVGEGQAFDQAFQGVFDIATRTSSSLESTGTLFTRIAQAGKEIKLSTADALALTETINEAIQLSGGSAESADAAIQQLIQGLQSGVLRGEEFNSVMEQAPRLAQALAEGLGVTTGELRKQAEAGRLTSQVVIGALQGQADVVAREFDKLPPTIGRAIQNLSTEWTRYVGEVDRANGVSAKAAGAINALAGNLGTLGTVLLEAGKAVIAFKAFDLAATFAAKAAAARGAAAAVAQETAATTANTAAVAANTAAHQANNAAKTAGAAAAGNLAASSGGLFTRLVGGVATLGSVGAAIAGVTAAGSLLLDGLKATGTGLGELVARMVGYRDRSAEVERQMRAEAAAAEENRRVKAALAQAQQQASDRALELSKAARQLVTDFEGMRAKGESVAESLEKVSKGLQLGNLQGIKDASAALDALTQKGEISGRQVRESLAAALNGQDLGIFATQARAAFDGSEQGARRLAAAIDAVGVESLRRAGTSVQELQTGFSTATNSAINDVDALRETVDRLGVRGPEVGRALAGSLDKALEAANTERAIEAVIERLTAMGQQGLLTGQQVAAGLDQAKAKLDDLKPGINSVDEALRAFGLKTQSQLTQTAAQYQQAWQLISTSTTTALEQKVRAFQQFKDAATAANRGIVPSSVALQEEMLKVQLRGTAAGQALADAMDSADGRTRNYYRSMGELNERLNTTASLISASKIADNPEKNRDPFGGQTIDNSTRDAIFKKFQSGTLTTDDKGAAQQVLAAAKENLRLFTKAGWDNTGFQQVVNKAQAAVDRIVSMENTAAKKAGAADTKATADGTGTTTTKHVVELKLNGASTSINTASASDADQLAAFMRQLTTAAGVAQ